MRKSIFSRLQVGITTDNFTAGKNTIFTPLKKSIFTLYIQKVSEERQTYSENSPWWGEHYHRYIEAAKHINDNAHVLDIACGNGFGTYLLSKKTKGKVIGADIDAGAVKFCSKTFENDNLNFIVANGTNLPFPDNTFHAVTSFETIEHTIHYKSMLKEFFRVLKKNSLLLLSTPNSEVSSPNGIIKNKFHTQEFSLNELRELLLEFSAEVEIKGQKYARYDKKSFGSMMGRSIENLLYLRGIRKLPLKLQNKIMKAVTGKNQYPSANDFIFVDDISKIKACKTLFAVCRK